MTGSIVGKEAGTTQLDSPIPTQVGRKGESPGSPTLNVASHVAALVHCDAYAAPSIDLVQFIPFLK